MPNYSSILSSLLSGPTILASGIFIGLILPFTADLVKPLLFASVYIFVSGSFIRLNMGVFKATISKPVISLGLPLICMLAIPSGLWLLASSIGLPVALSIGVLMYASSPPSTGNAAMAKMFGYKGELPMTVIVIATVMTPLTVPLLIGTLSGRTVDWLSLATNLLSFLGSAAMLAAVVRIMITNLSPQRHTIWIDRSVLGALFIFALATMAGVQEKLLSNPWQGVLIVVLAYFMNCCLQLIGVLLLKGSREERIALGLTMGNRNIGLLWAVAGAELAPETLLFFAATQLPIFTMPLIIRMILTNFQKSPNCQ